MKRNLLKEVISDAQLVRDVAIANAKKALEESINPTLKSMLVAKLEEMDRGEGHVEENEDFQYGEEIDIDEVLKELNDSNLGEEEEGEETENSENEEEEFDEDELINIEDMTDEDLSQFIQAEIENMVETGELEPGDNFESGEGEEGEDFSLDAALEDEEGEEGEDEEVDIDDLDNEIAEILREIEEEEVNSKEDDLELNKDKNSLKNLIKKTLGNLGKGASYAIHREGEGEGEGEGEIKAELDEAYKVIKFLKEELNSISLLNSKLLYTNKIFKGNRGLKESQMIKILEAFDKAKNVKEAKLVYTTLKENINSQKSSKPSRIQENLMSSASRSLKGRGNKSPIFEPDEMVNRFQHLAGIK